MTTGTTYTAQQIRERLDRLPRLRLAALPTPLDDLRRLSQKLGGPRILMKREDLTGLALGGNKIREFEYSIAQAVEAGCDVLLHGAAAQSNQSRQTAAVAARLGLKAVAVGRADAHAIPQGNLLLTHLFGAEVLLPPVDGQGDAVKAKMEALRAAGHKPFNTSSDGAAYRGIAYVDGFLELRSQLQDLGVEPDAVYVCSGAHTHTGMVVAARALGLPWRFVGISPSPRDDAKAAASMAELAAEHCRILDLDVTITADDLESYAAFVGPGYGVVTDGSREALKTVARTEGLILDPCYTGKTMAGLMAHIRDGWWTGEQTVVFVHTGGTPALFAYGDELGLDFTEPASAS
jgi:1-aminocyclopropane-1-carboxylate deaminase/D-cysteine desulfhydrase-like pyridoxal-dependent ACC family enzyme